MATAALLLRRAARRAAGAGASKWSLACRASDALSLPERAVPGWRRAAGAAGAVAARPWEVVGEPPERAVPGWRRAAGAAARPWEVVGEPPEHHAVVVTATGPDRPGIVSHFSRVVLDHGGNVEESRMARLAGDFSMVLLVSLRGAATPELAAQRGETIRKELSAFEGMQVSVRLAAKRPVAAEPEERRRQCRRLLIRGPDKPGVVYAVTEFLASNLINIESLTTDTDGAPFSPTVLFVMDAVVTLPPETSVRALTQHMAQLERELGVEVVVNEWDGPTE